MYDECGDLSQPQRLLLVAALDRILPPFGSAPSASDANAIGYVDFVIRAPEFTGMLKCLRTGMQLVDATAHAMYDRPFVDCRATEQDAVLSRVARLPHSTAHRFFVMLVRFAIAGLFCSPQYGGNRGGIGWQWIGFNPIHPDGTGTDVS